MPSIVPWLNKIHLLAREALKTQSFHEMEKILGMMVVVAAPQCDVRNDTEFYT